MNKEFKVGQRVWSFIHKKIMWVSDITSTGCFLADNEKLLINYYHSNDEFHKTADDMFGALGYELKETEHYYVYTFKNYTQWKIFISKKECSYYVSLVATAIGISEHLAIHQKFIEMGKIK